MPMLVFGWCPRVLPTGDTRFRTLKAAFGDGYTQRAADGINPRADSWPLEFSGTQVDIEPIKQFLDSLAGYKTFLWTPPLGVQSAYVAEDGYRLTPHGGGIYTLSVTFQQTNRLAP